MNDFTVYLLNNSHLVVGKTELRILCNDKPVNYTKIIHNPKKYLFSELDKLCGEEGVCTQCREKWKEMLGK